MIRPSGTEPKAKIYVDVEGAAMSPESGTRNVARIAQGLAARVVDECIGRIGFTLSAGAKLLPDYVDLDLKADFDTHFRSDLLASAVSLSHLEEGERLCWLRDRLAAYSLGADPLAPTGPALIHLLQELEREGASPVIHEAVVRLSRSLTRVSIPATWVT